MLSVSSPKEESEGLSYFRTTEKGEYMKFGVKVMPREVILDVQGRAVQETLKTHDFKLSQCRVGKFIEIEVDEKEEAKALESIKKMAEFVLYNPLIETYSIQRLEA